MKKALVEVSEIDFLKYVKPDLYTRLHRLIMNQMAFLKAGNKLSKVSAVPGQNLHLRSIGTYWRGGRLPIGSYVDEEGIIRLYPWYNNMLQDIKRCKEAKKSLRASAKYISEKYGISVSFWSIQNIIDREGF